MNEASTDAQIAYFSSPDRFDPMSSQHQLPDYAAACTVQLTWNSSARCAMSKPAVSTKRLLPGWARMVLILWGIAALLLLLLIVSATLFTLLAS